MPAIRISLAFYTILLLLLMSMTTQVFASPSLKLELQSGDIHTGNHSIFKENNRIYASVRSIGELLGAQVVWIPETNQVEIQSNEGHDVTISLTSREVIINGQVFWSESEPLMRNDRLYLPIRLVAELLHMNVYWDSEHSTVKFWPVPRYEVQSGDTVEAVSNRLEIDAHNLRVYNGINGDALQPGEKLTIVFSEMLKENEWTEEELQLLAKIIHAEAGYESLEGKIAVGNVVLNRVEHDSFPNTIRDVIYQPGQFSPVRNGMLETIQPNDSSLEAALKVLQGENEAGDALYFYNPNVTRSAFFTSRTVEANIGNHRFVK